MAEVDRSREGHSGEADLTAETPASPGGDAAPATIFEKNVVNVAKHRVWITWALLGGFGLSALGMVLASTFLSETAWKQSETAYSGVFTVLTGLAGSAIGYYYRDIK